MKFISLHNQTEYSLLESLCDVKELFKRAKELGQDTIAITEHGNFASSWEALKLAKSMGIKLIIGSEFYFKENKEDDKPLEGIVLLAKNREGYKNLLSLHKKGFENGIEGKSKVYPVINLDLIKKYSEGVVCLTGNGNGLIAQAIMNEDDVLAEKLATELKSIFKDDLAIEIVANNMERFSSYTSGKIDQKFINRKLIKLANKLSITVVPTCDTHYVNKEDYEVHDALLAIGSHQNIYSNFRLKYNVNDFYLKSAEEMFAFFSRNYGEEYAEQLLNNSVEFANKCENAKFIDPKFSNPSGKELPTFPVKDQKDYKEFLEYKNKNYPDDEDDKAYLRFKCENAFLSFGFQNEKRYRDRVEEELDVFNYCGVNSYMLIVADYMEWCKNSGIATGTGRGSAGGSLVAYLLGIHCADPLKYDLVFERFFNKLKTSYADIDLDFEKSRRQDVIRYIISKYGEKNVCNISNVIGITPKVYARDIARTCELGGNKDSATELGNLIADTLTTDIHSVEEAVEKSALFSEYANRYPELLKYKKICNKLRSSGEHAAGIIISKRPLEEIVPLRLNKDNLNIIEFDKDQSEEAGLVKMDILGLNTLDIIKATKALIEKSGKVYNFPGYEVYDKKTYDLITAGDTFGVFQFGTSAGTIDLCKKIKPKNIEDLSTITTLARPASKEIREAYVETKDGKRKPKLFHPLLARAFDKTLGFPLYDESLLLLAKDVAGWDLGEADKLRKLTKEKGKNPEKARKWKEEFIEGAIKNGVSTETAEEIWVKIVEPFGKYSFNKSHAVLYSFISFETAYLKAHYPVEFLLANLMAEIESNAPTAEDNIEKIKKELKNHGINILAPSLNDSNMEFTLKGNNLLTGFKAIKFLGDEAINDIITKRPFKNFYDFMSRVDSSKVRANNIQALISCGCFDQFKMPRKQMFLYCSDYRKKLQVWSKKHNIETEIFSYPWASNEEWNIAELYALEMKYMKEAFIAKPFQVYGNFFKERHQTVKDIRQLTDKTPIQCFKGIVRSIFLFKVKKETSKYLGQDMAKITLEDGLGEEMTCTVFPDRWADLSKRLKDISKKLVFQEGLAIQITGSVNEYEGEKMIILDRLINAATEPQVPNDLESKKVNLKTSKSNNLQESLEDMLINEGLLKLD